MEKKLKTSDGTIMHYSIVGNKSVLHNWEGAALIPQGNKRLAEYYLFGIKHTKDEWDEKKKSVNGQPWYKTAAGKASGARV